MSKSNQKSEKYKPFTFRMQKKLAVLFSLILLAFAILCIKLVLISRDNGENYKRKVLSQLAYNSTTLPAKRGEIVDRNGSKLAVSQKVYNVIVDSKELSDDEDGIHINSTLDVLYSYPIAFSTSREDLKSYIDANPNSRYKVVAKKQSYETVKDLMDTINNPPEDGTFLGVWLEDAYQREYPYSTLACDTIGFVQPNNEGAYGLEEFYNDILTGVDGREYGYLNDDENLERTIKPAQDGKTLVTSLDMNIQSIVEKHIANFCEEHRDEAREGDGASNVGVIIMNPNNGEVIAMASAPTFDLNDPRNTDNLDIQVDIDPSLYGIVTVQNDGEEGNQTDGTQNADNTEAGQTVQNNTSGKTLGVTADNPLGITIGNTPAALASNNTIGLEQSEGTGVYQNPSTGQISMTIDGVQSTQTTVKSYAEAYEEAYEDAKTDALNSLWRNFCINSTYEPGSTMKPFTMATGLEEGILIGNENFVCNGVMTVGDHEIHCNNRLGHGDLTFSGALEQSCNVAFMKMGSTIGKTTFQKYNQIFNFGLKTNIDLTGEALTKDVVFNVNTMTPTDLAISAFGQGFNTTMIQMITGFCSLINGGYYYQPHVVTQILDSAGAVYQTIEPRVLKQTVSENTSEKIKELCINVVAEGTGKSARPAGYMIGGKTGTAEKYPRGQGNYVVSFMGFAPADDPQLVIYTVIDEPNVAEQASAKYATLLTKDILTEVLPYLNIFMTEELSEKELAELAEKELSFSAGAQIENKTDNGDSSEDGEGTNTIELTIDGVDGNTSGSGNTSAITFEDEDENVKQEIQYDPETGYAIEPSTGILLDPETGAPIDVTISNLGY